MTQYMPATLYAVLNLGYSLSYKMEDHLCHKLGRSNFFHPQLVCEQINHQKVMGSYSLNSGNDKLLEVTWNIS